MTNEEHEAQPDGIDPSALANIIVCAVIPSLVIWIAIAFLASASLSLFAAWIVSFAVGGYVGWWVGRFHASN